MTYPICGQEIQSKLTLELTGRGDTETSIQVSRMKAALCALRLHALLGGGHRFIQRAASYIVCCKFNLISVRIIDVDRMRDIMILQLILDATTLEISLRFLKLRATNPESKM